MGETADVCVYVCLCLWVFVRMYGYMCDWETDDDERVLERKRLKAQRQKEERETIYKDIKFYRRNSNI